MCSTLLILVSFGTYTGTQTRSSSAVAGDGLSEMVEQLRQEFAAIQEDFVEHSAVHRSNFTYIHNKLLLLQDTIDDITQTTEPPAIPSQPVNVAIYENCTMTLVRTCTVGTSGLGTAPHRYSACSTPPIDLASAPGYLKDVFCSVSSVQDMPVTATLRFNNGLWACICQVIEIQNVLQMNIESFQCHMYERRCPHEILVPLD